MSARARRLAGAVDDFLARVSGGAESLSGAVLSDAGLLDAVAAVGSLRRLVDAVGVELAGQVASRCEVDPETSLARREGERSAAALIALRAGITPVEATTWVTVARATTPGAALSGEPLPPRRVVLATAVESGTVSVEAAAHVCSTLDTVARVASPVAVSELETTLVTVAPQITAQDLRRLCRTAIDQATPEQAELREDWLRSRSGLRITQDPDGLTRWSVTLHPEAAGILQTALDARTAPRRTPTFDHPDPATTAGPDAARASADPADHRTLAQRRVDALVDLARTALAADTGQVAGSPVTMVVTVPLDTLTTGLGTAHIAGIDEPVSAGTARRLAADAELIPVVLGTRSDILDQGRTIRLATPAQRRALTLRDQGCLWPGCAAPPGWCETAHLQPWHSGGRTDLANLALFCPFHHRVFDQHGWQLVRPNGIPYLIPPAHIDATRTPRPAGRPTLDHAEASAAGNPGHPESTAPSEGPPGCAARAAS